MSFPRILIATESYSPVVGGGETQARSMAEGLVERGAHVALLTRRFHKSHPSFENLNGVEIHRLGPIGSGRSRKWAFAVTAFVALLRLRDRYDLVFVSGFRILGVPAALACRWLGKSCVLKADSLGEMSGEYFRGGLEVLRLHPAMLPVRALLSARNRLLRGADAFVAVSSQIAGELEGYGVKVGKIHEIPNSVDTRSFRPLSKPEKPLLRRRLGLPEGGQLVIYVGRLVAYKGLPLLLEVWAEVMQRHPDALLLLVGEGGYDMANCELDLKRYARKRLMENRVLFTGAVANVHEYLQSSDIFVFPTHNEAFGIALVEAMACGLPVISTGVGGLGDILVNNQNGLLIQPGSFEELKTSLETLLSDERRSESLGVAARNTAAGKYSKGAVLEKYVELFRSLAARTEKSFARG